MASKNAKRRDISDKPELHKTHFIAKPLLGGLAIFIGFAATLLIFLDVDDKFISLVIGTIILVLTGLLDDVYNLKPIVKLFGQTTAASVVVFWNINLYVVLIDYFNRFFIPEYIVIALIIGIAMAIGLMILFPNYLKLVNGMVWGEGTDEDISCWIIG